MVQQNCEVAVNKEYAIMIISAMRADQQQLRVTQQLAAECLNKSQDMIKFKGSDLQTFLEKSIEKGDDIYKETQKVVKNSIQRSQPKRSYIPKTPLTKTQTKEAVLLKRKYIDQMTKSDTEYKELSEEIYYLLISKQGHDEGVQEDMMKVIIMGNLIASRAYDIVWKELGFDEQQIEEGMEQWKVTDEAAVQKDGGEAEQGTKDEADDAVKVEEKKEK